MARPESEVLGSRTVNLTRSKNLDQS